MHKGDEAAAELAALKSQQQQTSTRPTQHAHAPPAPTDAFLTKSSLSKHSRAPVCTGKQLAGVLRSSIQPIANGLLT